MFTSRSWASALLATQGNAGNVAAGETVGEVKQGHRWTDFEMRKSVVLAKEPGAQESDVGVVKQMGVPPAAK
ncbi:MAG: hypothetical protein ABR555_09345 [Pyrinomonadaceae bacterium]